MNISEGRTEGITWGLGSCSLRIFTQHINLLNSELVVHYTS